MAPQLIVMKGRPQQIRGAVAFPPTAVIGVHIAGGGGVVVLLLLLLLLLILLLILLILQVVVVWRWRRRVAMVVVVVVLQPMAPKKSMQCMESEDARPQS